MTPLECTRKNSKGVIICQGKKSKDRELKTAEKEKLELAEREERAEENPGTGGNAVLYKMNY